MNYNFTLNTKLKQLKNHNIMTKIYCKICNSANIITIEVIDNPIYYCNMCKDHIDEYEPNRILQNENYNYNLVIDSSND